MRPFSGACSIASPVIVPPTVGVLCLDPRGLRLDGDRLAYRAERQHNIESERLVDLEAVRLGGDFVETRMLDGYLVGSDGQVEDFKCPVLAGGGGIADLGGGIRDDHLGVRHCRALLVGDRADHSPGRVLGPCFACSQHHQSENTYSYEYSDGSFHGLAP